MLVGAAPKDGRIDPPYRVQRHSFDLVRAGILPASGNSKRVATCRPELTLDSDATNLIEESRDGGGMNRPTTVVALAVAAAIAAYAAIVRPWMLAWGATKAERSAPLPGDDLEPNANYVTTRAVPIDAPPDRVWPWLVQMGQDRAGFYTHNWVERLLRSGIKDVDAVHPEWQTLAAGDLMRTNRDIGGKPMGWPVVSVDGPRSLVVRSKSMPAGTYAFVLEPIDADRTRLIVRDRAAWKMREWPFAALIYEPLHAYMETGLIRGLKRRAERAPIASGGRAI
jgi:hypothetical protein